MIEYISVRVLSLIGAGTIFYLAVRIEEYIMERLTGEGVIKALCTILEERKRK